MHSISFLIHPEPYHTNAMCRKRKFIICGISLKTYGNDDKSKGSLSISDHGDH